MTTTNLTDLTLQTIIYRIESYDSIRTDLLLNKYGKSLYIYYKRLFCCEPILMVTSVFNACSYALIVPSNDFNEYLANYVELDQLATDEDKAAEMEVISFNSKFLKDFIK